MKKIFLSLIVGFCFYFVSGQTAFLGLASPVYFTDAGSIFQINADGTNYQSFRLRIKTPGSDIEGALTTLNGKIYGMAGDGGLNGKGVIYSYDDATGTYTDMHDFDSSGYWPRGSLTLGPDGSFYGMTYQGGASNMGTIFKIDPNTYSFNKLYDFDGINGSYPWAGLVLASNNMFYGLTAQGGQNGRGVLFQFDPATDIYTKQHDFDNVISTQGGNLVQALDSDLYGLASNSIFRYNPNTQSFSNAYTFVDSTGISPVGKLLLGSNGNLYGLTGSGGLHNHGVVFNWSPATGVYTRLMDLGIYSSGGGSPIFASDGNLYFTLGTDSAVYGNIWRVNPQSGAGTRVYGFGVNGYHINGAIVEVNGKIFGTIQDGNPPDAGNMYALDIASQTVTVKFQFNSMPEGGQPWFSLVKATNGQIFGTTQTGGANGYGTIFTYSPGSNSYTKGYDFDSNSIRACSFIAAADGKLYGVSGGGYNYAFPGSLLQYDPYMGTMNVLHIFDSLNDAQVTLNLAYNGKLYGTTGGDITRRSIFEYDLNTNTYNKLYSFKDSSLALFYCSGLTLASNGLLYGVLFDGFSYCGDNTYTAKLFSFDPVNVTYTDIYTFGTSDQDLCVTAPTQANNGKLYGYSVFGGIHSGSIYQLDPAANQVSFSYAFDSAHTNYTSGPLLLASDGFLYGTYGDFVANNNGLYRYDATANAITYLDQFVAPAGVEAYNCMLLEENLTVTGFADQPSVNNNMFIYPVPVSDVAHLEYSLSQDCSVTITLTDIQGKRVKTFADNSLQSAGKYNIDLQLTPDIAAGTYLVSLKAGDKTTIIKVVKR